MSLLICPNCSSEMTKSKEEDVTTDVCSKCGGMFLDKDELNILAVGMAGNIEYCSLGKEAIEDILPVRTCPLCAGQEMQKIYLLCYTDIIFDYCPHCHGFYLDKGEVKSMNEKLQQLTDSKKAEEYRGHIDNHLVRVDILHDVMMGAQLGGALGGATSVSFFKLSVYFVKSLDAELKVYSEKWTHRFAKRLGLFKEQDIQVGENTIDKSFIVQGKDVSKIKALFLSEELRKELVDFINNRPKLFSQKGSLAILDTHIEYVEGPYTDSVVYDVKEDKCGLVSKMVRMASLIEQGV